MITRRILKICLVFCFSISKLTFKMLIARILMINCWLSTVDNPDLDGPLLMVNSWQSTVDYQVLMDLDQQELIVQILMARLLIVYFCCLTLDSLLLNATFLWSSVDKSKALKIWLGTFDEKVELYKKMQAIFSKFWCLNLCWNFIVKKLS